MDYLETFFACLEKYKGTCFVVEGKNDVAALERLGVEHIRPITTQLYLFAEHIAASYSSVVILIDLDPEGKKLYGRLKEYFSRLRVRVIDEPRELLFKAKVSHIEGLVNRALFHQI